MKDEKKKIKARQTSPDEAAIAASKMPRGLAVLLGTLTAIGPLSIDMYLPSLPLLTTYFQTNAAATQLSLTACLIGLAVGQIFVGPFSDAYGRKKPLLVSMAIFVLASLACVFTSSIEMFLVFRLIEGLSGSAGLVIARAIARDLYTGHQLTRFFTLLMLVNGVAPIAAPVIGGQMITFFPWNSVFIFLTVVSALLFVAVFLRYEETLPVSQRLRGDMGTVFGAFAALFKERSFIGHCLVQCFAFSGLFAYISGSPFVLQNIYGISPQAFSLIFALNGAGLVLSGQIAGRLAGRFSELAIMQFGVLQAIFGSVFLLVAILLYLPLWLFLIPPFITITSLSVVASSSFSLAMQKQGKAAGSASALLGFFSNVSGGLMAPLVGIGGGGTAVPMGIVIFFGECLAGVCFLRFVKSAGQMNAEEN